MKKHYSIIIVFLVIVMVCTLTVGYSAFVTEMSISKIVSHVRVQKDVRITNVQFLEDESSNVVSNSVDYDEDSLIGNVTFNGIDSVASYKVTFTNFGNAKVYADVSKYTGSISATPLDAMGVVEPLGGTFEVIMLVSPEEIKTESFNIDFSFRRIFNITYDGISGDNQEILEGETYSVFLGEDVCDYIEIYMDGVRLDESSYDTSYGQLIISNVTGDVTIKERERVARLMKGTLTDPGSEVCMGDECFYIISNDGTTISMLSKYNLHVGNTYDDVNGAVPLKEPTGIQNEKAIGWFEGYSVENPIIGSKPFSLTNYWADEVSSYPAYVYNEKSNIYVDVENYRSYLKGLGVKIGDARLIKLSELEKLGCNRTTGTCINTYDWLYSTTYWTGDAGEGTDFWRIYSNGALGGSNYSLETRGVRPVIEVASGEVIDLISFTIAGAIYYASEGMTWEEFIESDFNNLNLVNYNGVVESTGLTLSNNGSVYVTDEIIANGVYYWKGSHSGGSVD